MLMLMSAVETGQMSAAETGQMSAVETRHMSKSQIRGWAQNHQNGPKWVENGRQASRIGLNESHSRSGAFRTGPLAKTLAKTEPKPQIGPFPRRRGTVLHPCTSVPQLRYAGHGIADLELVESGLGARAILNSDMM